MANKLLNLFEGYDRYGDPWIVNILGEWGESFEISLVRRSNKHGFISFGWFDKDKLLVSQSYHQFTVKDKSIFERLIILAHERARELNRYMPFDPPMTT